MIDPQRCIYYLRSGTVETSGRLPFVLTSTDNLKSTTNFGQAIHRCITVPPGAPGARILCTLGQAGIWRGIVWGTGYAEGPMATLFRPLWARYRRALQWALVVSDINHGAWVSAPLGEVVDPAIVRLVLQHYPNSNSVTLQLAQNGQIMAYAGNRTSQSLIVEDLSKDSLGAVGLSERVPNWWQPGSGATRSKQAGPSGRTARLPDEASPWPFATPVPQGFRLTEQTRWKARTLWILKGKRLEGLDETILVVRANDLPGKATLGKSVSVGIWAAEIAAGIPVGTSELKCGGTLIANTGWNQPLVALGSGDEYPAIRFREVEEEIENKQVQGLETEPDPTRQPRQAGKGKDLPSVEITSLSGAVLEADPDWLVVGAATIGGNSAMGDVVDALCTAMKEELKRRPLMPRPINRPRADRKRTDKSMPPVGVLILRETGYAGPPVKDLKSWFDARIRECFGKVYRPRDITRILTVGLENIPLRVCARHAETIGRTLDEDPDLAGLLVVYLNSASVRISRNSPGNMYVRRHGGQYELVTRKEHKDLDQAPLPWGMYTSYRNYYGAECCLFMRGSKSPGAHSLVVAQDETPMPGRPNFVSLVEGLIKNAAPKIKAVVAGSSEADDSVPGSKER